MDQRNCRDCGVEFTPRHGRNVYCEQHSGRQAERQRARYDARCAQCGVQFRSTRKSGKLCSDTCRALYQKAMGHRPPNDWRAPRLCRLPADHPVMWVGKFSAIVFTHCNECGGLACSPEWNVKTYCSGICCVRARERRRRARRGKRHIKRRVDLFVRDDWTCWLCGGRTTQQYDRRDPLSPTVDHITPRSQGGGDEPDNLATAHMICNSRRRDTDIVTHSQPCISHVS